MLQRLRAPIVLVHGLFGFDRIRVGSWQVKHYFPGIVEHLRAAGNCVAVAQVHPTKSVAQRAQQLKRFIHCEFGTEKVHLVGHSMGGLDSRYMISRLGMENQILTLTTIGTPHRGTAFADWGVKKFSRLLRPLLRFFHLPYQAFFDLMTESCQQFNEEVVDAPNVRYFSIAGKYDARLIGPEWWLPARIVREAEGDNDGVVSVHSARYGERTDIWDADHLNLVNWPNRGARKRGEWLDRAKDYGLLVDRLCELGYGKP